VVEVVHVHVLHGLQGAESAERPETYFKSEGCFAFETPVCAAAVCRVFS
jgi:hypothetical protein